MSPEAQRIAIAEACGWRVKHTENGPAWTDTLAGRVELCGISVPDYPNDLNAMHEAEKVLGDCEIKWRQFQDWLYVVCEPHRHALHATAAQRAEAFLRTIGKWEEST
jgi:hypothetical protein